MKTAMRIEGFAKIDRDLARLSRVSRQDVVEAGLVKGGLIMVDEAKLHAPVATGTLRDSIAWGFGGLNRSRGTVRFRSREVLVGPRADTGFYGWMVEMGTEDTAPQPFMRSAFEIAAPRAVGAAIDHLAGEWRAAAKG